MKKTRRFHFALSMSLLTAALGLSSCGLGNSGTAEQQPVLTDPNIPLIDTTSQITDTNTIVDPIVPTDTTTEPIDTTSVEEPETNPDIDQKLANITKPCGNLIPPKISGSHGHATRYWDCCKPTCSWRENVDTTANPFTICKNCDENDNEIAAFDWSPNSSVHWQGYEGTKSGCESGGVAYTCNSHAPYAVCENLAYGYAAAPDKSACGKCFQLDFDGGNKDGAVKQAHRKLEGKTMIVMASNTGSDVGGGQFDIMIPGGGVGIFDGGCGQQWGIDVSNVELVGERYGGFLTTCQGELGYDRGISMYQECVYNMCENLWGSDPKYANLMQGCQFFTEWMYAADNPTFTYKEVECPQALLEGYSSTFHTTKDLPATW